MQAAKKETVFEFPDGGIADFYMTDEQFAELERRETVGHGGIANVHNIADRIAEYGRYGDDTLAHVETGELVVPKALLDKNPALKASIFEHLEELGVEDPERYIVGSEFNSLNPDTQLPEFFLKKIFKKAKKVFKKVVKGVKKALKKVGKVLKKASSVILPVVLNVAFPGMGAIMTGALSGGIGTLINGGNLKDALKAAAIGGVTGAVVKGGYNKLTGKAGFVDSIKSEVSNLTNLKSQFSTAGGILDPTSKYYAAAPAAPAAGAQAAPVTTQPLPEIQGPPTASEAALIGEPTFAEQITSAADNVDLTKSFPQLDAPLDPSLSNFQTDSVLDLLEGQAPAGTAATSTLPQAVQDYMQTAPGVDEFGNKFVGDQLVPKGGMATSGGTNIIEAAAQSGPQAPISSSVLDNIPKPLVQGPQMSVPGGGVSVPPGPQMSQIPVGGAPTAASAQRALELEAIRGATQGATQSAVGDFTTGQVTKQITPPGFFESLKGAVTTDTLGPDGKDLGFFEGLQTAFAPRSTLPQPSALEDKFGLTLDQAKQAVTEATPNMIRTYLPAAAVAGLAAKKAGAFDTPTYDPITIQELEASQGETAAELVTAFPEIYRVQDLEVRGSEGPYRQDTLYAYDPQIGLYPVNPFGQPQSGFNQQPQTVPMQSGGAAFPRRTGGIDPSEGVPNQDSVRAMLMPGEFVMTTKAVRGMSRNGDSREGIKNMYSMMRNLEARERKMG
jgi:hypothetical protein|tara:strand:- start:551 stop:2731 length:2181 start_codon:yes stop_codon:yes gene_type:complete